MEESRWVRVGLRVMTGITLAFIYLPLLVVAIYAFNPSRSQIWPPSGLSLRWFADALTNSSVLAALGTSLAAAAGATAIALVLGTAAAIAIGRHRFFGREAVSFLVVLPLALPGVVTGIALAATF